MHQHPDLSPLLSEKLDEYVRTRTLNEAQAIEAARLLVKGVPDDEVALYFGVSAADLYAALGRYKIPTPEQLRLRRARLQQAAAARAGGCKVGTPLKLTQRQALDAAQRIEEGESIVSTAASFGVRPMTLRGALRRHDLMPASPEITQQQASDAADRIAGGETLADAARAFGVWPITLINLLRRHGFEPPPASRSRKLSFEDKRAAHNEASRRLLATSGTRTETTSRSASRSRSKRRRT